MEVSHRNDPRDGMPPLEDRLRAGAVQLENRRLQGDPSSGLLVSIGAVRRKGTDSLEGSAVTGRGEMVSD